MHGALRTSMHWLDVRDRRALRATSRLLHPTILDAGDAALLLHLRVCACRDRLYVTDETLATRIANCGWRELDLTVREAATFLWHSKDAAAVQSGLDALVTVLELTGLFPPQEEGAADAADATTALHAAIDVMCAPDEAPDEVASCRLAQPACPAAARICPATYAAMAILSSMCSAARAWQPWACAYRPAYGNGREAAAAGSLGGIAWAARHVPGACLARLPEYLWRSLVAAEGCVRGPTCALLDALPQEVWPVVIGACCRNDFPVFTGHCGSGIERFCNAMSVPQATRTSRSPSLSADTALVVAMLRLVSQGMNTNDAWAAMLPFLQAMDVDLLRGRGGGDGGLRVHVLAALYPVHARVNRIMLGAAAQHDQSEAFICLLRSTHCPTVREWMALWEWVARNGCSRNVLELLSTHCPPDIWLDDARLCRDLATESWLSAPVVLRLFGHNEVSLYTLREYPHHRATIRRVMAMAREAVRIMTHPDALEGTCHFFAPCEEAV